MLTSDFDYHLPSELIAQEPTANRHESRLMVVCKKSKKIIITDFLKLDEFLSSEHLVVVNNTKVFPARLFAKKKTGGMVEILLVCSIEDASWEAMVKPSSRTKEGTVARIDGYEDDIIIGGFTDRGRRIVNFKHGTDVIELTKKYGKMPLPPYIKREKEDSHDDEDMERYQTIFAEKEGSIAAPTASLHFSEYVKTKLSKKNIKMTDLTLHVGPGTFVPVKTDLITEHKMEHETFSIDKNSVELINSYNKILAVGTTVVRTLETVADADGKLSSRSDSSNLFIYPGYKFKLVNNMLTNFHLPKSTLIMLVCALAGKELILEAYNKAISEKFRFYSYGDAMLILDE